MRMSSSGLPYAENKVYLVGGSIPEREGERLFNTATVWSPEGRMLAKHRKMHLFDIDGKQILGDKMNSIIGFVSCFL